LRERGGEREDDKDRGRLREIGRERERGSEKKERIE